MPQEKTLAEKIEGLRVKSGPGADREWYAGNEETIDKVQELVKQYAEANPNVITFAIDNSVLEEAVQNVLTDVKDRLSPIEQSIVALATPLDNYGTIAEALAELARARKYQLSQWRGVAGPDAGGRLPEEWLLLLNRYVAKANEVYAECDGSTPAGRIRFAKYIGILGNLAFWAVQSVVGQANDDRRQLESEQQLAQQTGCKFHSAPESGECGGVTERA